MEFKYGCATSEDGSHSLEETTYDTYIDHPSNALFTAFEEEEFIVWVIQEGRDVTLRRTIISDDQSGHLSTFFHSLVKAAFDETGAGAGVQCEDRSLDEQAGELAVERSDPTHPRCLHLYFNALKTLYELVISPIEDLIYGEELIIVPEGPLWMAPFAAFVDSNSHYLSELFRFRVIPSLTSLKLITESPEDYHCKSGALLVGDPWVQEVVCYKIAQLPFAREEVEMIGRILDTVPLTGTDATKEEVLTRLSSVALVHIAAHGSMENGEIALAPNRTRASQIPKKDDYLLTMRDVMSVNLRARLVVLSCCHSGRGEIKSEGVVGIARAFLGAGARSVLVALWAIDDDATLEFMKIFYQHLARGNRASEALKQAMESLRESTRFCAVKHWAPFVLIGDDVKLEFRGQK